MTDINTETTHPFSNSFKGTRTPGEPATDFECSMLDAILAMHVDAPTQEYDENLLGVAGQLSPPYHHHPSTATKGNIILYADKLFPVPLLMCLLSTFASFSKEYHQHPNIVKAPCLLDRRKIN